MKRAAESVPRGLGGGQLVLIQNDFSVDRLIEGLDDKFYLSLEHRKPMLQAGAVLCGGFARRVR